MNSPRSPEPADAPRSDDDIGASTPDPSSRLRGTLFQPIADGGRAEIVERRLVDAITRGHLHAGERLPAESELSRVLGVAPVTVREALLALRHRGLVVTRRGRHGGSFVADHADPLRFARESLHRTSVHALRDLAAHYGAITGACVHLAARRADAEAIPPIRDRLALLSQTSVALRQGVRDDVLLEVVALSQSARLTREQMKLQAELSPFLRLVDDAEAESDGGRIQSSHLSRILDAVETGDAVAAAGEIEHLLDVVVETLVRLQRAPA